MHRELVRGHAVVTDFSTGRADIAWKSTAQPGIDWNRLVVFLVDGADTREVTRVADRPDELLTTGQVAELLGSSRQHVVDLCDRGSLPCQSIGTHRRIRRGDVAAFRQSAAGDGMSKEAARSLWLHTAVAGKVVDSPDRALAAARRNLGRLLAAHPRGEAARQLRRWERLLSGPIDHVLDALVSRSQPSIELRQSSPFAGLLSDRERRRVLEAFSASRRRQ